MVKGIFLQEIGVSNIFDAIKNYSNAIISLRVDLLAKLIQNHSSQLE